MKTLLAIAVMLILAPPVMGEEIPEGCYQALAEPGVCWHPPDNAISWIVLSDKVAYQAIYGKVMGAILNAWEADQMSYIRRIRRLRRQLRGRTR